MALEVGVNSYISVADATTYFADRIDAEAWDGADATQKAKALVTAAKRLDMQRLRGKRATATQGMEFPRCYPCNSAVQYIGNLSETASESGWLCETDPPQAVKHAQCEEALFLLQLTSWDKKREREHALGVVGSGVGDANESAQQAVVQAKASQGQRLLSPVARQLMAPYTVGGVSII